MQRILGLVMVGALLLTAPSLAFAAATQSSVLGVLHSARPAAPPAPAMPAPLFSVLGVPVVVNAPVAAPYCNCATEIYGGQPMKGAEAAILGGAGR